MDIEKDFTVTVDGEEYTIKSKVTKRIHFVTEVNGENVGLYATVESGLEAELGEMGIRLEEELAAALIPELEVEIYKHIHGELPPEYRTDNHLPADS